MPSFEPPEDLDAQMAVFKPPKPFSISFSAKAKPPSGPKPLTAKKRPHSSLGEDDSDNDEKPPKAQLVSTFDHSAGGAIGINGLEPKKGPLVIQAQKNRDWREESRKKKGKNLLPEEVQQASRDPTQKVTIETDDAPKTWGLSFVKTQKNGSDGDMEMADTDPKTEKIQYPVEPRTEDEEAMDALLGNGTKESTLILPAAGNQNERVDTWTQRGNEDDAFRADVASRPDAASLEEYAAVPVEEIGAALFRGMAQNCSRMRLERFGWREGDAVGNRNGQTVKPKEIERRPALLGIGAKELPEGIEELGAWGKTAKSKRKVEKIYNPVMLRNADTGEMISEEEYEKRQRDRKSEDQDRRERRHRNLALDCEKKDRKRLEAGDGDRRSNHTRRDRSRSIERNRYTSSKRARSRSAERDRHRSLRRESSRSNGDSRHRSSRRDSSISPKRNYGSSRRDRSRSKDRRHSDQKDHGHYDKHERTHKDRRRRDRDNDREYDRPSKVKPRD